MVYSMKANSWHRYHGDISPGIVGLTNVIFGRKVRDIYLQVMAI